MQKIDDLLREMDEAGVRWGVVMGRQSEDPLGVIPNDEIAECVAKYPGRFVGWAGLDLSQPTEWCLEEKCRLSVQHIDLVATRR